jgi:nucleoside-diphosphate-sugar epimerase
LHDKASIEKLFRDYPTISVVVDSVPPLREGDATAGVRALTEVLQGANVRRIIYLSTTGVFGVRDGSEVTEETPPAPWNSQGAARLDSEEVYRHYVAVHSAVTFTALRLPAIYGSDRGVAHSIRAGSYALVEDGSFWTNRIHVDDLASVIAASVLYEGGLPGVLCVSDDEPTLAKDVAAYVCKREGLPYPSSVSREDVERRGGYTMLSNQRVRNERMKQLLNIQLRYPSFREGIYSQ